MKIFNILLVLLNTFFVSSQISHQCTDCLNRQKQGENIGCINDCSYDVDHLTDINCLKYTHCEENYNLIKIGGICYCETSKLGCNDYLCPKVEEISTGLIGYTTYKLSLILKNNAQNIYAMYGIDDHNMIIPPAFQVNQFAGANIGGVNNAIIKMYPESKYDSWFTIEIDDGNIMGRVSSIGIDFSQWTDTQPLIINNGAIFLEDPFLKLSTTNKYVIAHLTLKNSEDHIIVVNVDGKINLDEGHDQQNNGFRVNDITFNIKKKVIH